MMQSKAAESEVAASEAAKSEQPQEQQALQRGQRQPRQELPKNYVANMLGAIGALQKHEKCAPAVLSSIAPHTPLIYACCASVSPAPSHGRLA